MPQVVVPPPATPAPHPVRRILPSASRVTEHPAVARAHPERAGENRDAGGRDLPNANAEHDQDAADGLHPEYDVGEEAGQAARFEVAGDAREPEREELQRYVLLPIDDAFSKAFLLVQPLFWSGPRVTHQVRVREFQTHQASLTDLPAPGDCQHFQAT